MKNKILKTGISLLLVLSMLVSPAEKIQAETYTGAAENNITYTIDTEKKVITIEGEGTLDYFSVDTREKDFSHMRDMHWIVDEGITRIKHIAYPYYMKSIHLPVSLKVIDDGAFQSCRHLESIVIPHGVEKIGKTAFDNCQRLKTITNYSSAEIYLPNHRDLNDYPNNDFNVIPYDYFVDGKLSTTVPPGKTAIGKLVDQYTAVLNCKSGILSKYNSRRYVYYRFGEPLKLPSVTRKGYIFCGWTAKQHSNYAWRNITNEDTENAYGSTVYS